MTKKEIMQREQRSRDYFTKLFNGMGFKVLQTPEYARCDLIVSTQDIVSRRFIIELKVRDEESTLSHHQNIVDIGKVEALRERPHPEVDVYLITIYNDGVWYLNDLQHEDYTVWQPREENQWHGKKTYCNFAKKNPCRLSRKGFEFIYGYEMEEEMHV